MPLFITNILVVLAIYIFNVVIIENKDYDLKKILQIVDIYIRTIYIFQVSVAEDHCVQTLLLTICNHYKPDRHEIKVKKLLIQAIKITTANSLVVGTFILGYSENVCDL